MRLITLLTDYHFQDYYLAKVKSRAIKLFPNDTVLDICHHINHHDIDQAAFVFNAMIEEFSTKDLHFLFINLHYHTQTSLIVAKSKNNGTVVAPNNGILGLLKLDFVSFHEIPNAKDSFLELKILDLMTNFDESNYQSIQNPNLKKHKELQHRPNQLMGEVLYIDSYGNGITNITKQDFEAFTQSNFYKIVIQREEILNISQDYSDNREAGLVVFFNHQNLMEIANCQGNANLLMSIKIGKKIIIQNI